MKKFKSLVIFIMLAVVLSNCGDIVESDSNINKTEISFGKVLDNQESNVILPLKVGNVWYYEVKNYDDDGVLKSISFDSIKVLNIVTLGETNENWYEVYFPIFKNDFPVLMINTDKGLLIREDRNLITNKFLWAKFPEFNNLFLSHEETIYIRDVDNKPIASSIETIGKSGEDGNSIINNDLGNIESIFYQSWFMKGKSLIKELEYFNEYYLPDFGLVRAKRFSITKRGNITNEYEYIKSIPTGDNCRHNPEIQVGKIAMGSRIFNAVQMVNDYGQSININQQDIIIENNEIVNFGLIPKTYPISVPNAGNYNLEYTMSPLKRGIFNVILNVRCNLGCWYKITFEGECI